MAFSKGSDPGHDHKPPNGTYTLGTDATPYEAVDLIQKWLKEQ